MNTKLSSIFGASWRTAVTGYMAAIFFASEPYLMTGHFNLKTDWPNIVGACISAIAGNVAKDAKVSGAAGAITQSDELKAATEALAVAKATHNDNLIKMAQAVVDGLSKPQTPAA